MLRERHIMLREWHIMLREWHYNFISCPPQASVGLGILVIQLLKKAIQKMLVHLYKCQCIGALDNLIIRQAFSMWSLSSIFDEPARIKRDLKHFTAHFITINIWNVSYYMLYKKKIAIGLKIFEYITSLNVLWHRRIPEPGIMMTTLQNATTGGPLN